MRQTTTPMNYSFNKSYYENFLTNRFAGITGNGKVTVPLRLSFMEEMVVEDINGVDCVGYVDIKNYVKRTYNGDKPMCLDEKFKNALADAGGAISTWDDAVVGVIDDIFGTDTESSFICTLVISKLGMPADIIVVFNGYRDNYILSSMAGKRLFVEYRKRMTDIVVGMFWDIGIHQYLWDNYLKDCKYYIEHDNNSKALDIYMNMGDYICERYGIEKVKRVCLDD